MARFGRGERGRDSSSLSNTHAFLSQEIVSTFEALHIGATLRDETGWYAVHSPAFSVAWFEYAHHVASERYAYNNASVEKVRKNQKTLLTQHAGFRDFFVPVGPEGRANAVLVTGPFSTTRVSSPAVLERWRWLTGRQGHPSDPEFSHYLSTSLETVTFDAEVLGVYQRFLECYSLLIAGRGDAYALATKATSLRERLEKVRHVEQMWDSVRSMIDERTVGRWLAPHTRENLHVLGIERLPEHVLVGFTLGRTDEADPVDDLIRRDGFQRACVEVAQAHGAIAGRAGEHGVVFLIAGARSSARAQSKLQGLMEDATKVARRRFGLKVHFGASALSETASLAVRYDQALRAAERALSSGVSMVHAENSAKRAQSPIRQLRRSLGDATEEQLQTLPARFERYIEAVAAHSGYRLESCSTHLEVGYDQAAQALLSTGMLSERSYLDQCQALERAAREASTLSDLFAIYRRSLLELVALSARPTQASRDRSVGRAIEYIHQHFVEPLSVPQVASIAGFAPNYFAQLFKQREKMSFDQYLRRIRIERAQQLLKGTDLSAERVGQLSGFPLRPYFFRVFKACVGLTPTQYRESGR